MSILRFFLLGLFLTTTLEAITINQALERVIATYPGVHADYQTVRAAANRIDVARGGYKPTIYTYGSIGVARYTRASDRVTWRIPKLVGIGASQPLYKGGRTIAAIKGSQYAFQSQELSYEDEIEQQLLETATLYIDVLRTQEVLKASVTNRDYIQKELKTVKDRYQWGDVTRTDLAQAKSRLAGAEAQVIESRGNLRSLKAELQRLIDIEVINLEFPKPLNIPENEESFIQLALSKNKELAAQMARYEAAQQAYWQIKGELYPELDFDSYIQHNRDQSIRHEYANEMVAELNLTVPLYQAGKVQARMREACAFAQREGLLYQELEKVLRQRCIQIWESLETAKHQITAFKVQQETAEIALKGVRDEESAGLRTVLDVLNAEYEVLNAKVNLIDAHRNHFVSELEILCQLSSLYESFLCRNSY